MGGGAGASSAVAPCVVVTGTGDGDTSAEPTEGSWRTLVQLAVSGGMMQPPHPTTGQERAAAPCWRRWLRAAEGRLCSSSLPALGSDLGFSGPRRVPAPGEGAAEALRHRGCPPSRCLSEQLFNCGATFGKGSGMCPGSGPARDAGAWQLRPFQLCAQSRNSPGIRGRGKRLGWKNPTAPTHPALRLSHRCPTRGAAPRGRMGGAGGVGGGLHPSEPRFGGFRPTEVFREPGQPPNPRIPGCPNRAVCWGWML